MSDSFSQMKAVNWDSVQNFVQVVKNFYQECEAVQIRSEEEVMKWRDENQVYVVGTANFKPILQFNEAGIPDYLMKTIQEQNFATPTVIQSQSWPIALSGVDMVGIARTGSGKTLSFILPSIIHIMAQPDLRDGDGPVVLVLSPTRELCKQVAQEAIKFGGSCGIHAAAVYGGVDKSRQVIDLKKGAHIVVACPGRLLDLLNQGKVNLHRTTFVIMDEADRMLDMGFEPQIRKVISQTRQDRQTLMFSATWPTAIQNLAAEFMNDPTQVYIGSQELTVNKNITQVVAVVEDYQKQKKFLDFYQHAQRSNRKILIFTDTKRECDNIAYQLKRIGNSAAAIHGDKDQRERESVLNSFRNGRISTLVATDVAARGLDIDDIGFVINYDFPQAIEDYVHRIGRTARANNTGTSFSMITEKHGRLAEELMKLLRSSGVEIPPGLEELKNNAASFKRGRKSAGRGGGNNFEPPRKRPREQGGSSRGRDGGFGNRGGGRGGGGSGRGRGGGGGSFGNRGNRGFNGYQSNGYGNGGGGGWGNSY